MSDYEDDALDIYLREPDDIGARIVLLTALSIWPEISAGEEQRSWRRWLDAQGVLDLATRDEIDVLAGPVQEEFAADLCERAVDSLPALAWATALLDEIPLVESEDDQALILERIPVPDERIVPFLDQLVLRDEDSVALERERAELWNWRLASEAVRRESTGADLAEIEEIDPRGRARERNQLCDHRGDTGDFLVDGVQVRLLEDDMLDALIVRSEERLRAFNWLCGLTEWDAIHLPD